MVRYSDQIDRIKDKIVKAKNADKTRKVFGADKHKYIIHEPTTIEKITEIEKKYSIELPDCYKSFSPQSLPEGTLSAQQGIDRYKIK